MTGRPLGATPTADGTLFRAWTTTSERVEVRVYDERGNVLHQERLRRLEGGEHEAFVPGVRAGSFYDLLLDGTARTDPYARFLPRGVHGPAEVVPRVSVGTSFPRRELRGSVVYELHVGTFTPEGTFRAARQRLAALAELGVTTIELMPVGAFDGSRGWGYDGVAIYAPFAAYGRPEGLRDLVREGHALGLTMMLDVVYNHLGPSGSQLRVYAPEYFCPDAGAWGDAPDFTNRRARAWALDNARMWFDEFGFDGLRVDATHAIRDTSEVHLLSDLRALADQYDPPRLLIAEDDRNDPDLLLSTGFDAVWADDFHHQVQVLSTGDRDGYYAAYEPTVAALARTIEHGWIFEGQPYPTTGTPRGKPADDVSRERLVYCAQNHDQIGNRALGTRLSHDASIEIQCAATVLVLFLPMTAMLFMGEEWASSSPFLYFTDHAPELGARIVQGRRAEFAGFRAFAEESARAAIPDPQAEETFLRSKLCWEERERGPHRQVLATVREMLRLRREDPVLSAPCRRDELSAEARGDLLVVTRNHQGTLRRMVVNLRSSPVPFDAGGEGDVLLATTTLSPDGFTGPGAVLFAPR